MPDTWVNINGARVSRRCRDPFCAACDIQATVRVAPAIGAAAGPTSSEAQMPYTYTLTSVIPASAQDIYDAWLDSRAHAAMTGGRARMSDRIGAEVSAWDGYIDGRNLELIRGERIVQSWRTSRFTGDHEDSIIAVTLEDVEGGTLLTLVHSNVPDDQRNYQEGGWQSKYFEPMQRYFARRGRGTRHATRKPSRPVKASSSKKTRRTVKRKTPPGRAKPIAKKPASKRAAKRRTPMRTHR
jgi:uncharacterized protein YndB with AHSA1/START domain